ncbi:MAG: hypothetical protein WAM69_05795 [Candidatus Sulfotelmatobacter sp.]
MRVTLLGVLTMVAIAVLLVCAGYELRRANQARAVLLPLEENPDSPLNP